MSVQENKELVRRFYSEVGHGDYSNLSNMVSSGHVDRDLPEAGRGPDVVRNHMEGIRSTFPDFVLHVEEIFAEGDYVITRVTGHGTHLGEWMGVRPTGRRIQVKGINIDRTQDGRIVEHRGEADSLDMLLQMGVDPFAGRSEVKG